MLLRISIGVRLFIIAGVFLFTGCQRNNDQILATIDGKDTITVNDFKILLQMKFGKNTSNLSFFEKRKYLDLMVNDHAKLAYAREKGYDQNIDFDEDMVKHSILSNKAFEKYVLGHFINDDNVEEYKKYIGATLTTQNLVFYFNRGQKKQVALTKQVARERADSISSIINVNNFNVITEEISDYKNPSTRRGNLVPDRIVIGKRPYNYEREIFRLRPGMISRPIEIDGAFVIAYVISRDESTKLIMDNNQIRNTLREKFDAYDRYMIQDFLDKLMDSMYVSNNVEIRKENVQFMLSKLKDSLNVYLSTSRLNKEELNLELVRSKGWQLTIGQFLQSYGKDLVLRLKYDGVVGRINNMCRSALLEKQLVDEGFMETDEYQFAIKFARQNAILGAVDAHIQSPFVLVSDSQLQSFFINNRDLFRNDGSLVVSEISSSSIEKIESVKKALQSGISFEKAAEIINGKVKIGQVKHNPKITLNFKAKGELVATAIKMKKDDISDIIVRKDGGYSILKILDNNPPVLMSFDSAKGNIQNSYYESQEKLQERQLLFNLKKRWKVVLYENNLNKF